MKTTFIKMKVAYRQQKMSYGIIYTILKRRSLPVSVSYKKLWKLLIDKDMTRTDLRLAIGVSPATAAKLSKSEPVSLEVLMKICEALQCNVGDIMDVVLEDGSKDSQKSHVIIEK